MYNFNNFTDELEYIVSNTNSYQEVLKHGCNAMAKLVQNKELFTPEYVDDVLNFKIDNTLYASPNNNFVVQLFTWPKNTETPVHDHDDTWGIMGVYKNKLKIKEYKVQYEEALQDFSIEEVGLIEANENNVCYVEPPPFSTHKLWNPFEELCLTIHVYGKEIKEYNIYDLEKQQILHQVVN